MVGFKWVLDDEICIFHDNRLCFGLKCGPCHFNDISCFIAHVLRQKEIRLVQYLDDFLCIASNFEACANAQAEVINLLRYLGFYVSWDKVCSPSQVVTYLGIVVDSSLMEIRLPEYKLAKAKLLLAQYRVATYISKHDLEVLTGLLAHCAVVVRGGRVFCRRLYDLYKVLIVKNLQRIKIPVSAQCDLQWWSNFMCIFNGKSAIRNDMFSGCMISDSSLRGFGAYLNSDWLAGTWPDVPPLEIDSPCGHICQAPKFNVSTFDNINMLELWPVLLGIHRWYHLFKNCRVSLLTDNTQVLGMLRKGLSSNTVCMDWIREIYWVCVIHNIDLVPDYIATGDNTIADALSRIPYKPTVSSDTWNTLSMLCCNDKLLDFFDRPSRTGQSSPPPDAEFGGTVHSGHSH